MKTVFEFIKKTTNRELFFTLLNQAVLSLGAVAVVVVLSNLLSTEVFGKTRFLASVLAIAAFFSLPGLGPVILSRMSTYSQDEFKHSLLTQLRWGAGASIGAFFFGIIFYLQHDYDLAWGFFLSGMLAPLANLYLIPGLALAGLKRFKEKFWYDTVVLGAIIAGATFGAWHVGTVAGTMIWYFSFQSIATLILLWLVMRRLPKEVSGSEVSGLDTVYGKQLTLFQLPFTLLPALEKALVFFLLGPIALAVYVVITLPIEHARGAFRSFLQFSALPHLTRDDERSQQLRNWFYISILVSVGIVLAVCLFAYALLPILFSDYLEAQPLIYLSSLAALFLPAQVYVLGFIAKRSVNRLFSYATASFVSDVLFLVFLTTLFGLLGAVLAKVLTSLMSSIIVLVLNRTNVDK